MSSKMKLRNPFAESALQKSYYIPTMLKNLTKAEKKTTIGNMNSKEKENVVDNSLFKNFAMETSDIFDVNHYEEDSGSLINYDENWVSSDHSLMSERAGGDISAPVKDTQHPPNIPASLRVQEQSVLSRYIERFRHGEACSREKREERPRSDTEEFWWLRDKNDTTKISQTRLDNTLSINEITDLETKTEHLQRRTEQLLSDSESIEQQIRAEVSTEGLGSSLPSHCSDTSEIPKRPMVMSNYYVPTMPNMPIIPSKDEDDILYKWRLRRKMEQARLDAKLNVYIPPIIVSESMHQPMRKGLTINEPRLPNKSSLIQNDMKSESFPSPVGKISLTDSTHDAKEYLVQDNVSNHFRNFQAEIENSNINNTLTTPGNDFSAGKPPKLLGHPYLCSCDSHEIHTVLKEHAQRVGYICEKCKSFSENNTRHDKCCCRDCLCHIKHQSIKKLQICSICDREKSNIKHVHDDRPIVEAEKPDEHKYGNNRCSRKPLDHNYIESITEVEHGPEYKELENIDQRLCARHICNGASHVSHSFADSRPHESHQICRGKDNDDVPPEISGQFTQPQLQKQDYLITPTDGVLEDNKDKISKKKREESLRISQISISAISDDDLSDITCVSPLAQQADITCVSPLAQQADITCVSPLAQQADITCVSPLAQQADITCVSPLAQQADITCVSPLVQQTDSHSKPPSLSKNNQEEKLPESEISSLPLLAIAINYAEESDGEFHDDDLLIILRKQRSEFVERLFEMDKAMEENKIK